MNASHLTFFRMVIYPLLCAIHYVIIYVPFHENSYFVGVTNVMVGFVSIGIFEWLLKIQRKGHFTYEGQKYLKQIEADKETDPSFKTKALVLAYFVYKRRLSNQHRVMFSEVDKNLEDSKNYSDIMEKFIRHSIIHVDDIAMTLPSEVEKIILREDLFKEEIEFWESNKQRLDLNRRKPKKPDSEKGTPKTQMYEFRNIMGSLNQTIEPKGIESSESFGKPELTNEQLFVKLFEE